MKKTLIALAVAASAAVSGSAMAWTANGTGNSVSLGGTLTPTDVITPWEVKVGAAVNGLDAAVRKGDTNVDIPVKNAIPVLGIRTVEAKPFLGNSGLAPQISYGGALDLNSYNGERGLATLTLEVRDKGNSNKIGTLTTKMFTGAESVYKGPSDLVAHRQYLYASKVGDAFFGGLPKSDNAVSQNSYAIAQSVGAEYVAHFVDMGATDKNFASTNFADPINYSAFYYAGISSGADLSIALTSPVVGNAQIQWNASLPVTISYR
ncbi:hypothetical protein [Escherichia coli]|uniref:F4 family fimbrial subunit n=1 Tax=Escherichia coli TaxID=562 RepID=UPI000F0A6958|nr:hypothetical protein [Escherichia coli]